MGISGIVLQSAFQWFGLLQDVNAFLVFMILAIGGLAGSVAKKLTIAGFASFITFIYISLNTDLFIFDAMLYALITIVIWVLSSRAYNLIYGDSEGSVA